MDMAVCLPGVYKDEVGSITDWQANTRTAGVGSELSLGAFSCCQLAKTEEASCGIFCSKGLIKSPSLGSAGKAWSIMMANFCSHTACPGLVRVPGDIHKIAVQSAMLPNGHGRCFAAVWPLRPCLSGLWWSAQLRSAVRAL